MNPETHMNLLGIQANCGKDNNAIILGIQFSMPEVRAAVSAGVGYTSFRKPLSWRQAVGDTEEEHSAQSLLQTIWCLQWVSVA